MITGYTVNKPEPYCRFTLRTFHNGVDGGVDEGWLTRTATDLADRDCTETGRREQQPILAGGDPSIRPRHRGV